MSIDTTLNIHKSIIEQIESAAQTSGLTINNVIIRLLLRAKKEYHKLYYKGTRRIKYQTRDEKKQWEPGHVRFSEAEYEYFNDMKKLYKMSISNILAFAVRNFLKSEICEMIRTKSATKPDNYYNLGYAVVMELVENIICWKIYWGLPQNLACFLPEASP